MSKRSGAQGRVLATVLFTDIVGSTEIATEMGDLRWRELIRRHHRIVREELERFGGKEQDTAGDGFFATFPVPGDAIRCACAITERVRELGIEVRAGLHTGQLERAEGKAAGIGVVTAARIMALAGPGEVLVSGTLHELVAGEQLEFEDRGERELKGVPGEWRVFSVEGVDGKQRGSPLVPEEAARLREDIQPLPLLRRRRSALLVIAAIVAAGAVAIVVFSRHAPVVPGKGPLVNALVQIDPKTKQIIRIDRYPAATQSTDVSHRPPLVIGEGKVWLGQGVSLLPVDARTGVVQRRIGLDGYLSSQDSVAVGFGKVWLAQDGLTPVDPATGRVHSTIPVPGMGSGIGVTGYGVVAGDGGVWTSTSGGVARVNGRTGKLVEIIALTGSIDYIAIGDGAVWVADKLAGTVTRIDPRTDTARARIRIGGNIAGIAAGGGYVWVLDSTGSVTPIDATTGSELQPIRVGSDPVDITFGLGAVWVADQASGTITRIDVVTKVAGAPIDVGGLVAAVAVDEKNHSLWAAVIPTQPFH